MYKIEMLGVDLPSLIERHNQLSEALIHRTEKRYNLPLSDLQWRRAYPYDPRVDGGIRDNPHSA